MGDLLTLQDDLTIDETNTDAERCISRALRVLVNSFDAEPKAALLGESAALGGEVYAVRTGAVSLYAQGEFALLQGNVA
jgi:hypothetical protein